MMNSLRDVTSSPSPSSPPSSPQTSPSLEERLNDIPPCEEHGNDNSDITYTRGSYDVGLSGSCEDGAYGYRICNGDAGDTINPEEAQDDDISDGSYQEEESDIVTSEHNSENSDSNFEMEDEEFSEDSISEHGINNSYLNDEYDYAADISNSEINGADIPYPYFEHSDSMANTQTPNIILYTTEDAVSISSLRQTVNHNSEVELPNHSCPSSNLQFHPVRLKKKSVCMTYILTLFLGVFGAHHFYLGRPKFGTLYIFTGGLLGMGYVVDLVRVPWLVDNANLEILHPELRGRKYLMDAYLLWLPPFGLLGFHHFYLGNMCHGFVYMATVGALIMGWLLDMCLIPLTWIKKANKQYSFLIESINRGGEDEAVWTTAVTSPHMPPATPVRPPPYTEVDYTETDNPPSYNEVIAMDMQESYS